MSELYDNMITIYGEKGKQWLDNLPTLQEALSKQWGLSYYKPCEDLSYNYVTTALQGSTPVVLKMGIDLPAVERECLSLQAYNGHGTIELLEVDIEKGAILMARAIPGDTLCTLFPEQDLKALAMACNLITEIHKTPIPKNHQFPLLSEWLSIIDKGWDLTERQLQLARQLKTDLLNQSKVNVLLHGDMHYANVLSQGNEWVVIDPKGVIGDPLYDLTGCLLREPFTPMMESSCTHELLRSRMEYVARYAQVEVKIIWAWTFVQTVMSICWSLEDGQDVSLKRKFLGILESLH